MVIRDLQYKAARDGDSGNTEVNHRKTIIARMEKSYAVTRME